VILLVRVLVAQGRQLLVLEAEVNEVAREALEVVGDCARDRGLGALNGALHLRHALDQRAALFGQVGDDGLPHGRQERLVLDENDLERLDVAVEGVLGEGGLDVDLVLLPRVEGAADVLGDEFGRDVVLGEVAVDGPQGAVLLHVALPRVEVGVRPEPLEQGRVRFNAGLGLFLGLLAQTLSLLASLLQKEALLLSRHCAGNSPNRRVNSSSKGFCGMDPPIEEGTGRTWNLMRANN
jgi:hypothetical protein